MKLRVYRLCVAQYIFYDINYSIHSRMYTHLLHGLFYRYLLREWSMALLQRDC